MSLYNIAAPFPNADTSKLFSFVSLEVVPQVYMSTATSFISLGLRRILDETQDSCYYSLFVNGYCDIGYHATYTVP